MTFGGGGESCKRATVQRHCADALAGPPAWPMIGLPATRLTRLVVSRSVLAAVAYRIVASVPRQQRIITVKIPCLRANVAFQLR